MDRKKIIGGVASVGAALAGALVVNLVMSQFKAKPERPTSAQVEQAIARQPVYATIRSEFPEDYAALVDRIKTVAADGSLDEKTAMVEAARAVQAIRQKYASYSRRASHETLTKLLKANADIIDKVERVRGSATCLRFNNQDGLNAVFPDADFLQTDMEAAAALVFKAIGEGRRAQFDPDPVTPEDRQALQAALKEKGIDAAAIPAQPDCKTTSTLLRAIADLPGDSGERLRAMMTQTLLSTSGV